VRRWVVVTQHAVAADRQHFAITHNHRAEGASRLIDDASLPHGLDRLRHMLPILLGNGPLYPRHWLGQCLVAGKRCCRDTCTDRKEMTPMHYPRRGEQCVQRRQLRFRRRDHISRPDCDRSDWH